MYRKILVPLDGSALAECVLPHVAAIAAGCNVPEVTFVRVVEPIPVAFGGDDGVVFTTKEWERLEAQAKEAAQSYLGQLLKRVSYGNSKISAEILPGGRAADMISEYAQKSGVDLIVIATHGRSGVSRWVWGSVADKILRSAKMPVLMVRPENCPSPEEK